MNLNPEQLETLESITTVVFFWAVSLLVAYVAGIRSGQQRDETDTRRMLANMLWNLEEGQIVTHQNFTVRKAGDHWQTDDVRRQIYDCDDEGICELLDFLLLTRPDRSKAQ
jgi:hypothetical protein